ncbi:dinitrogenase iron-molybdenum cofactor N-terminal domain-containing protein [Endothiovibrio diazotrophicus]
MSNDSLSRELALRIGLAARVLPDTEPARLMKVLVDSLGLPLSAEKLWKVTVKSLRTGADGDFVEMPEAALKQAAAILRGETDADSRDPELPEVQPYAEGDMPDSIRVAMASNSGELMDGHFGTCARFLIYQISPSEVRLVAIRSALGPEARDDKNAYRASLIEDCQLLYVVSIGGPAAAKVIRADVHPVKRPEPVPAPELAEQTRAMVAGNPPPWLAKAMGVDAEGRVRFELEEEESAEA